MFGRTSLSDRPMPAQSYSVVATLSKIGNTDKHTSWHALVNKMM